VAVAADDDRGAAVGVAVTDPAPGAVEILDGGEIDDEPRSRRA
jgi:hypothetical protein